MADKDKLPYEPWVPPCRVVPEWYKNFNFILVETMDDLRKAFDGYKDNSYYMGFDTETTDLDAEKLDLVGYSFCLDGKNTYYVPVNHFEYEHNLGDEAVAFIYDKMCKASRVFMYNARFDMRVIEYYGYKERKEELDKTRWMYAKYDMSKVAYFDVAVAVWLADTNIKFPSLKQSSLNYLGFEQMHFDEVIEDAGNFYYLNPGENEAVAFYAGADALCTYLLVPKVMKYFKEGQIAAKADNAMLYPLMHFENEKLWLDKDLINKFYEEAKVEVDRLEKEVYSAFGYAFNLNSPIQVGQAFERAGIDTGERTSTGNMATGVKVLEKLSEEQKAKIPALNSFVKYKEMGKLLSTYLSAFKKQADSKGYVRAAYKTSEVPTGRLACGADKKNTFFSGINLQALPKPHVQMEDVLDLGDRTLFSKKDNILFGYKFSKSNYDENGNHIPPDDNRYIGQVEGMSDNLNVRACITAKMYEDSGDDEFVYASFDYAAEELRVTANLCKEPTWTKAFLSGGDIHHHTAVAIWGEEKYNRDYRKKAKIANFGILYGMSSKSLFENPAFGFKTMEEAEEFYEAYKKALPTLFQWQDRVKAKARRSGEVHTVFGRPRRLRCYYKQKRMGFADRTSVNTLVQGASGDILKIVMCKLWKRLFNHPDYREHVAWRVAIHDEIGYTIRVTKLLEVLNIIENTQTFRAPQWQIPILTEPSIGWSMGHVYDFVRVDHEDGTYEYKPSLV